MKKRFTAILTALLCMCAPMTAFAEEIVEVKPAKPIYDDMGNLFEYTLPEVTIKTDTFTYTNNTTTTFGEGFYLVSDIASPDLMIVGSEYDDEGTFWGYIVTPINTLGYGRDNLYNGMGVIPPAILDLNFGDDQDFEIGDLIKVHGGVCHAGNAYVTDTENPESRMECIGNGVDVFGEEFARVIRMQMVLDQEMSDRWYENGFFSDRKFELVKGDVNIDDELSVLDCLAINRNLLIGEPLCDYAKLAGDINENGTIDAVDSLSILKETIGLTENFE